MLLLIFRVQSEYKIDKVLTLREIDNLFDDIGNYILSFVSLLKTSISLSLFHAIHSVKPYPMLLLLLVDADSELGLPLLSPLPKSTGMNSQKKSESSSDPEKMKASSQQVRMK